MKLEIEKRHIRLEVQGTPEKIHTFVSYPKVQNSKLPVVILVHGFTQTGTETQGIFLRLMDLLNSNGLACVTFDCRGSGYSDGKFEDMTVTNEIQDLRTVLSYVIEMKEIDNRRIGIVGQSLGGVVAIAALYDSSYVTTFVFWATPSDFYQNMKAQYGEEWGKYGIICHEKGLYLKSDFFYDLEKYNVTKFVSKCNKPKLIIHGSKDNIVPVSNAHTIYETAANPKKIEIIKEGTHGYKNQKELEKKLLILTSDWLVEHLNPDVQNSISSSL